MSRREREELDPLPGAERDRVEQRSEGHARAFADAIIQSLPGIFYLFTSEGRFVRWNEGFEAASGYSSDEIARLHPLDFFRGEEKTLVEREIARVLTEGAAHVEAHFTAKTGTRTPYFFTGRRVLVESRPHVVGMGADITARREAERSLRSLARAVAAAGDIVFLTDPEGLITQVNEQFTRLYGHAPEEVVGRTTPRILKSGKHPLELYQRLWATVLRGETYQGELCNRAKDGSLLDIEETITPFHDEQGALAGFLAVQREIGARKQAELKLAASEAHFRTLIENASDLLLELDEKGLIHMAGPSCERILGYRPDELVGRHAQEITHQDDAAQAAAAMARALAEPGTPVAAESRIRHRDGSWRTHEAIGQAVRDPAAKTRVVLNSRDVTERRRLEAQLATSDRMATIGTLASGVVHELNNPLAAIVANLELATRELDALAQRTSVPLLLIDELRDARLAAEQMRNIVRDLRVFSRSEDEHRGSVDVRKALDSSVRMAWNEIRHRARLETDYGELPLVEANESRLAQVFLNLLVNAAQAIPDGDAETQRIRVRAHAGPGQTVVVEIADTGAGMSHEVRERLFEPFFSTKAAGVGTGLGLAICQRIVTALGGRIEVESAPGSGSTFRVVLPASPSKPAAADAPATQTTPSGAPHTGEGKRGRVLIVDDEELLGRVIARSLANRYEVVVTTSGQQALERISAGERFDVILCDVMMPIMSGVEFHERLERAVPGESAKIIFLTGGAFTHATLEILDRCPNPRLEKPFSPDALRALLAARLR